MGKLKISWVHPKYHGYSQKIIMGQTKDQRVTTKRFIGKPKILWAWAHPMDHGYQCCGSESVLDPYSGAYWTRIRIPNTDSDSHMQIHKMKAKDVRFKILINNSETQLIKNFFG